MSSESTLPGTSPTTVPATQPITSSPLAPGDLTPPKPTSDKPEFTSLRLVTSPPIDPSQLNNSPAPIPIPDSTNNGNGGDVTSPPLRAPENPLDSAYLDNNAGGEPSSHPTVAETGSLARSPSQGGPGPKSGQLERREKKEGDGIIRLGSFGGEGLVAKPVQGLKIGDEEAVE